MIGWIILCIGVAFVVFMVGHSIGENACPRCARREREARAKERRQRTKEMVKEAVREFIDEEIALAKEQA